jgi:uncharacterized membrane protein
MPSIKFFRYLFVGLSVLFLSGCAAKFDSSMSPDIVKDIVRSEYRYALLGLWFGVGLIIMGTVLVVMGITASTSLVAEISGGSLNLTDTSIGFFLIIAGLIVIYMTKPKIEAVNSNAPNKKINKD